MAPQPERLKNLRASSESHIRNFWKSCFDKEPLPDVGGEEELEEADELRADCQERGDILGEAGALMATARVHLRQKAFDKSVAAAREAQALYMEAPDRLGQARAMEFVAEVWDSVNSPEKAATDAERARTQYSRLGDKDGEARMMFLTSQCRIKQIDRKVETGGPKAGQDEATRASKTLAELVSFCRGLDDNPKALGSALTMLADVHVFKERYGSALEAVDEAVPLLEEAEEPLQKANALLLSARVRLLTNDLQDSLTQTREALTIFREQFDEQGEKDALELLGQLREFDFRIDGQTPFGEEIEEKMLESWQAGVLVPVEKDKRKAVEA
mmetsp:Transcript_103116/g.230307  ORF Transcript_103116/g.230307 Transcript_103116/m.230307 type:complete len:329 (+) Transcript_103116:58-1044(+)